MSTLPLPCAASSQPLEADPANHPVKFVCNSRRWTWLLGGATVAWACAMLASLRWRFLDRLVAGATHGVLGYDFYPVPRGFRNLMAGNSIYLTRLDTYGRMASWYLHHPLVAVVIGCWTAPLPPMWGYAAFAGVSVVLLLLGGWLLSTRFSDGPSKAFCYFALFCSPPTYLMLWNAQPHVLLVLAICLILAGVMGLENPAGNAARARRWIQIGLLISLLSKPVALLMLPVLMAMRETRRTVLAPVAAYVAVSLAFLLIPGLNPGGYNGVHWLNMLRASTSPVIPYWLEYPAELNVAINMEVYSLPAMLYRAMEQPLPTFLLRLPTLTALLLGAGVLLLRGRAERIRLGLLAIVLLVLTHFLSYYMVWEYHFTSLLPALPVLLWLRRRETSPLSRMLLSWSFALLALTFLPTPACFDRENGVHFDKFALYQRVMPVTLAFLFLAWHGGRTLYAAWRVEHPSFRLLGERTLRVLPRGVALAGLLGALGLGVWSTVPSRLTLDLAAWGNREWIAHLEDVLSRPAQHIPRLGQLHRRLAQLYAATDLQKALAEFAVASRVDPCDAGIALDRAEALQAAGRTAEAETCYQQALESTAHSDVDVLRQEHLRRQRQQPRTSPAS